MPLSLNAHLTGPGPKRILALDGGGIRGALTLGFLEKIEEILRKRYGNDPAFRLCDYFDLIGGTSTGAIIATCLALGWSVTDVKTLYMNLGGEIFGQKTNWFSQILYAKFTTGALEKTLKTHIGERTLGSDDLRTGLCIVAKRADTGGTWPLINHPGGQFYEANAGILLRNALRASSAAPTYFKPEIVPVGYGEEGAFIDGGVSMHNNPGLLLFLVATLDGFPFHWETGDDRLLLVSAGTGDARQRKVPLDIIRNSNLDWAKIIPAMLMDDASAYNHLLLQYLTNSPTRSRIDAEIGDMKKDLLGKKAQLHYLRYNVKIERNPLSELGFTDADLTQLLDMSNADNRELLAEIGVKAAAKQVLDTHFPVAFDLSI